MATQPVATVAGSGAGPGEHRGEQLLLLGTKKGVFIGRSDAARTSWNFSGPHCSGTWSFCDVRYDDSTGTIYAGGQSNWYGPAVWRSDDLGQTWTHSSEGLAYSGPGAPSIEQVWCVRPVNGALYAGLDPAGLFKSEDGGRTWREVAALRAQPSSAQWRPTNAGLPLHAIVPQAQDGGPMGRAMAAAVSAGGVYATRDGGESWQPAGPAGDACVHALVSAADGALYQQNHAGVWRSDDGGATWTDVSAGLPSRFGFPLAAHPRDAGTVYAVPLEGPAEGQRRVPQGRMAVWRSRSGGERWERLSVGLPDNAWLTILREGLAVDSCDPAGVYVGTNTGQVFYSRDEGAHWELLADYLPGVISVNAARIVG